MVTPRGYATIDTAQIILETYGSPAAWVAASVDDRQRYLNLGALFVDSVYGPRAKGSKANVVGQGELLWPRKDVYAHGSAVDPAVVPTAIIHASVLAAGAAASGIDLFPSSTGSSASAVRRQKSQVGELLTETEWVSGSVASPAPTLPNVDALIRSSDLFSLGGGKVLERS